MEAQGMSEEMRREILRRLAEGPMLLSGMRDELGCYAYPTILEMLDEGLVGLDGATRMYGLTDRGREALARAGRDGSPLSLESDLYTEP